MADDISIGFHAHTLDRVNSQTLHDGAHRHAFIVDDVVVVTEEDGEHRHSMGWSRSGTIRWEEGTHTHKVVLPGDDEERYTYSDGGHNHSLAVDVSAFDGGHTHTLILPSGELEWSLTSGDVWALTPTVTKALLPSLPGSALAVAMGPPVGPDVDVSTIRKEALAHPEAWGWDSDTLAFPWWEDNAGAWTTFKEATNDWRLEKSVGAWQDYWRLYWQRKTVLGAEVPGDLPTWAAPSGDVDVRLLQKAQVDWLGVAYDAFDVWKSMGRPSDGAFVETCLAFGASFDPTHALHVSLRMCQEHVAKTAKFVSMRKELGVTEPAPTAGTSLDPTNLGRHLVNIVKFEAKKAETGETEQRLVTGPVLVPNFVDGQGDVMSVEAIEKTAYAYVELYNRGTKLGVQHTFFPSFLRLRESWLLKQDWTVDSVTLPEGTWMITAHVDDDDRWEDVKAGRITGFSIGGIGEGYVREE